MYVYLHNLVRSGARFHGIAGQNLPMVEYTLWESLSSGVGTQVGSKAKGLVDWKICFNYEHGCASDLLLFEYVTSSAIKHSVDTTDGYFRALRREDSFQSSGVRGINMEEIIL